MSTPSLSVIMITKNGEKTIEKSLQSVRFADEIIIVDSGSTDDTLRIAQKYTDQIFQTDWPGYGIQRQRALAKATKEWVLSIDSDEWVPDTLREEILATIKNPSHVVFKLPRRNQYCGKWIRFGDAGKDVVTPLFKRGEARYNDDIVHENLVTSHKIKKLRAHLCHNTYRNFEELIERLNRYSTLSAQMRFARGKKSNFIKAIFSALWLFMRSYFFRLGFLDGKMGFIVALYSAESSFYRHIKLIALNTSANSAKI